MFKKIFIIFLSVCILSSIFLIHSSAQSNYTEYYQYSGQAISSSIADVLSGYAISTIRTFPDLYRYWAAIRIDNYKYAILLFPDLDSYSININAMRVTVTEGCVLIYDQRIASYQNGTQTIYQAGLSPNTDYNAPFVFQLTRGYVIGNVDGCIAVNPEAEVIFYQDYILYILYTLIIFLFVFVAFKFLNKRWLLP